MALLCSEIQAGVIGCNASRKFVLLDLFLFFALHPKRGTALFIRSIG
jgi:hypothetical protein